MYYFYTCVISEQITFKPHIRKPMRLLPTLIFLVISIWANAQADQVKLKDLQQIINKPADKVQVLNFWATWCAPCVREIPFFEKLNQENDRVEVTLVSMDYDLDPNPEKVYRFISRKNLKSKVLILAESNPNNWIEKIDKSWSGALPATLIVNTKNGKRRFVERELKDGELEKMIEEVSQ
jgi:thiol-disulfide isomerase/thioredoxin